jgi:Family of unknown function (DUF6526)
MPDKKLQNYANHARLDPWFHLFLAPVYAITFIGFLVVAFRHPNVHSAWMAVFAFALIVHMFKTRLYALKVQDRVIRLEERLRLKSLLTGPSATRVDELSLDQLIALRFASDQEAPRLVEETLAKNLSKKDIKGLVQQWRADDLRV